MSDAAASRRPRAGGALLSALVCMVGMAPAVAQDAAEALRRCVACHEIRGPEGLRVAGGAIGPNLYGVVGRRAGSLEGYAYSDDLVAAGAAGLVFDEARLAAFAANPNVVLSDRLGRDARSRMPMGFPDAAAEAARFLAAEAAD